MTDWSAVRGEFPAASTYTYLNTAGAPPLSRRAASEGQRFYREMLEQGDVPWPAWLEQTEAVRARVARFVGADPDEVAFTFSASHAFTLLAALLGPPAHIVAMRDEFPSGTLPWLQCGHDLSFVESGPDGSIDIERIDAAITPRTRAVVSSSVMYASGFRQDVRALGSRCRQRGVPLVVDATQSIGVIPVDVRADRIDALTFSGYKWSTAGYGVGVLYVSRELLQQRASPVAGWWSARDPEAVINDRIDLKRSAAVFEVGSPHFAGIFALGGALQLFEEIGQEAIERRVAALTDYLHARLDQASFEIMSPRDRARRAGITIVRAADAAAWVDALAQSRIIVSARGAGIRVSVHIFNIEEDVDRFVNALATLRRGDRLPAVTVSASGVL